MRVAGKMWARRKERMGRVTSRNMKRAATVVLQASRWNIKGPAQSTSIHHLRGLEKAAGEFLLIRIATNSGKIVKFRSSELLAIPAG
jgi:hypothetical protein